jgi:hypothetical protein
MSAMAAATPRPCGCILGVRALAGILVPYPTGAAIGIWAAANYLMSGLTSPWVRRIIASLRRFG